MNWVKQPTSKQISSLQNGLAIIVDGDTCATAVPAGGYAYIKNNTHGLTDGLYKNTSGSAFPTSGGTASSSIFTAEPTGGLNALNSKIPSVVNNLTSTSATDALSAAQGKALNDKFSSSTSGGSGYLTIKKHNKIAAVSVAGGFSSVTIPAGFRPAYTAYIACVGTQGGVYFPVLVTINTNGAVSVTTHYNWATAAGVSGVNLYGSGAYIVA